VADRSGLGKARQRGSSTDGTTEVTEIDGSNIGSDQHYTICFLLSLNLDLHLAIDHSAVVNRDAIARGPLNNAAIFK
jgi:hypothetical protein